LVSPELLTQTLLRKIMLVFYASLGGYSIVLTARVIGRKADLASKKTASSKAALKLAVLVGSGAIPATLYCISTRQYSLLWAPGLLYLDLLPYFAAHIRARQLSKQ
jgi:hypothetical protein